MNSASRIINLFGGTRALAAALDLPPSTVQSWKDAGLIPAKHQQPVLDKAIELGLPLTPADFFRTPNSDKRAATAGAHP
jgi:hypothetical protein